MQLVYPLKPVITDHSSLPSRYDDDARSIQLTSACLTPAEAMTLLDLGARFEAVILLDGAGEAVARRIVPRGAADVETYAHIERLELDRDERDPVARIHEAITSRRGLFFDVGG